MEQFIVRSGGEAPPVANRGEIVVEKNSSENVRGEGETENTTKTVENPPPKQQKKKALPPEEADEHGRRRRSAADEVADARRVLAEATNGLGRIQEIGLDSGGRPFTPADYVLLEVDPKLAQILLNSTAGEENAAVVVRGRPSDNVVLCTADSTYQVKEIESSNTHLLLNDLREIEELRAMPPLDDGATYARCSIISMGKCFLEASRAAPTFSGRLRELLQKSAVNFYEMEEADGEQGPQCDVAAKMLTVSGLLDELQTSEAELRGELERLPVVFFADKTGKECLRALTRECQWALLDELVECYEQLSATEVPAETMLTFKCLREAQARCVPDSAVHWTLREFCQEKGTGEEENANEDKAMSCDDERERLYVLKVDRVCQARADQVLRTGSLSKEWPLGELKKEVEMRLPDGLELDYQRHLRGLATTTDSMVYGQLVRPLFADDLPLEADQRLRALFSVRGTWRAAELDPYLRPLIEHQPQPQQQPSKGQRQMSSQQSSTENNEEEEAQTIISKRIENLLLKHCRVAKKGRGGEKLYSLRDLGMDSF